MTKLGEEIEIVLLQLGTFPNSSIAKAVYEHTRQFKGLVQLHPDTCMTQGVGSLPIEQVRKLQDGFATNREEGRLKALAKELYSVDCAQLVAERRVLTICENAIQTSAAHAFFSEFMSEEDSSVAWDKFRKMVNKTIEDKVEENTGAL